ncbi:MAG: serine hydrolase [Ignavibacteriaceae bacterium]|nr:serine hydrolase [Ignavibacteriaceae bacterium]
MKSITLYFTILFLSCINIYAQLERLKGPINEEAVINDFYKPALLDSTQLDSLINERMAYHHIPGLTALINTKDDGIIWKRNYGYRNVALSQPVEDSTLFLIASISKTIVATAIMQFWEADSFDLDDNINDYLDEFQIHIPYHYNDTVTIRMIMTHTASIGDNWPVLDALTICGDSPISLDTFLINYFTPGGTYYNTAHNFVNAAPGTVWNYTNVGASILAYLVEKFSGMSFDQYCRENIFNPLEMNKSSWFLQGMNLSAIAIPYQWSGGQNIPYCHQGFPVYPVVFLRTNKIELEHFLSAYMNWGRYKGINILDSSTVDMMTSDQLGYPVPVWGCYQGIIWQQFADFYNRWPWGHDGHWYTGCRTVMAFQKEEGWGVILFMNSAPNWGVVAYIVNAICDYAQDITEVDEISNPISEFYLEQNYPNPFNPSTKIKYSIPQLSNVVIKVFDILGNEIETLVNEEKPAGTYEVTWNAKQLPSGVYFYQLRAGEFIQTRKMILIK